MVCCADEEVNDRSGLETDMAVFAPVTRQRRGRQKVHQVTLSDDVYQNWCHLATSHGIKTDSEVADFLLQRYEIFSCELTV